MPPEGGAVTLVHCFDDKFGSIFLKQEVEQIHKLDPWVYVTSSCSCKKVTFYCIGTLLVSMQYMKASQKV